MTILWVGYAIVLAAILAAGAVAGERVSVVWGLPRRVVWIAAMTLSAAIPLVVAARASRARPTEVRASPGRAAFARGGVGRPSRVARPSSWTVAWLRLQMQARRANTPARVVWAIASLIVAVLFTQAVVSLRRRRATWSEEVLGDRRVLVAPDVGPAVVGFARPRIVMPRWALALDPPKRDLMLRHETEHIRGRDQHALLFAAILLVLMPWNPAVWWMVRRLRLALEVDCDARVIRGGAPAHEYGLLLLAVGERQTHTLTLAASLTEERPLLERRIHAMITLRPRRPILASIPFVALALVAGIAAAQTPVPDTLARGAMMARAVRAPIITQEFIRAVIAAHHPSILNGDADLNRVNIVIDRNGEYVSSSATKVELTEVPAGGGGVFASGGAGGASAGAIATARATMMRDTAPSPQLYGIDRSLISANGMMSLPAGQIGPNRLMIGWVKLK